MPTPTAVSRPMPAWQPWAALGGFAFLLHFPWEMLQVPFYAELPGAPHWAAVLRCSEATGGDVTITWIASGAAALVGGRLWLRDLRPGPVALFFAVGLLLTIVLEVINVYVRQAWSYATSMPTLGGIGLAPLFQWVALPPVTLWLARRHLGLETRRPREPSADA